MAKINNISKYTSDNTPHCSSEHDEQFESMVGFCSGDR